VRTGPGSFGSIIRSVPTAARVRIRPVAIALLASVAAVIIAAVAASRLGFVSPNAGSAHFGTGNPGSVDPWTVPFLTRPVSGPIDLRGCNDVVIENLTFMDLGPDVEAIHLSDCRRVTIRNNDFARVAQAITVTDSTEVRIEWNRYEDILGPHARVGLNRANFVQFDQVRGGYIGHNKGRGGDTEDIVSLHASGGTAAEPLLVEGNHFEGTDWTSESGSAIALGDGGSDHAIARDNVVLDPGQVGIFIAGGTNNAILDNVIYGSQRPSSNVGLYVWNQSDSECSGIEVRGNKVRWMRDDGVSNAAWDQGNCGPVAGWSANDWDATLDPEALRVDLSAPASVRSSASPP
jgi:parallel beta helix pectate lyase-like protein